MCKLKWDPANTVNLGVAILDMIRRDLHICCTMSRDDRFDSTWCHDLIVAAKEWFLGDAHDLNQARIRRADEPNKELFYQIEDFKQEPLATINVTELEISQWIHMNVLHCGSLPPNHGLRDSGIIYAGWTSST